MKIEINAINQFEFSQKEKEFWTDLARSQPGNPRARRIALYVNNRTSKQLEDDYTRFIMLLGIIWGKTVNKKK